MMMANDADPATDTGSFTRQSIFVAAQTRWLSVEEIITVLNDAKADERHQKQYGIPKPGGAILERQTAAPSSPPTSGTVYLYDRVAVRNYKVDGHEYVRKRSNPAKIREDHVKLRYNGIHRISGTYVHSDEIDTLHRRVYRLIKTAEEKADIACEGPIKQEFVLVQYLDTEKAANIASLTAPLTKKSATCRRSTNNSKRSRSRDGSSNRSISSSSSYNSSSSDEEFHPTAAVATSASREIEECHHHSPTDTSKRQRTSHHTYVKAIDNSLAWNPLLTSSVLTNDFGRIRPKCSREESGPRNDDALDDIHFDDLWDMIESDAALGRGLEALIDPRVDKVVEQARKQEHQEQRRSSSSSSLKRHEGVHVTKKSSYTSKQQNERYGEPPMFAIANHQPSFSFDQHSNHMKQPDQQSQMPPSYATAELTNPPPQQQSPLAPQQPVILDAYGEEIEQFRV